jgi:tetratricopeptide (TPR) repeat protein
LARKGWALSLVFLVFGSLLPAAGQASTLKPAEVKARYREILGTLAKGDREAALVELVDFEREVVGDEEDAWRQIESFWKQKLGVIRDLLDSQTIELLRPIIMLHHDAYFEYVAMHRRYLANHSRVMATEMAEIYAERAGTPEARLFSGSTLTSFGATLWSPASVGSSVDLFYRAILVDPGNRLAVVGLSVAYEKIGDYEKAIEYLSRALLQDPESAEVQLRMALCQIRSDEESRLQAVANLQILTGGGSPDWIRSIAYHELARAHLLAQREDLAESVLREGISVQPTDQQLLVQLASLLDRQRRHAEVNRLLAAIEADEWRQISPRERYDVWEPQGIEAVRADLVAKMEAGLEPLSAGLVQSPAVEGEGR